jgi:hypothetical protein
MKVKFETDIPEARVNDLLCNALEGGSNYWIGSLKVVNPSEHDYEYAHDVPFMENVALVIQDTWRDDEPKRVDKGALERGLQLMADKYPVHFENFLFENDDAETGDVFLQLCCFGEIVYG